jgi:hypothetical protein
MHERIKLFASLVPFDPVSYTWIYLQESEAEALIDQNKYARTEVQSEHFWALPVAELTLPFERIAIVTEQDGAKNPLDLQGNVYTVVRGYIDHLQEEGVSISRWMPTDTAPSFVMEKIDSIHEHVAVKYSQHMLDTTFKGMTQEEIDVHLNDDMLQANWIVGALLSLGERATVLSYKTGYTCTGDAVKNAKRVRKGKKPFFEWKSIEIKNTREVNVFSLEHKGGTHASPKPHERMGHWRTYKTGRRVFVRSSIVNKHKMPEEGYIFHDYIKKDDNVAVQ